eukprot:7390405-Prymnesium_polylepis.1
MEDSSTRRLPLYVGALLVIRRIVPSRRAARPRSSQNRRETGWPTKSLPSASASDLLQHAVTRMGSFSWPLRPFHSRRSVQRSEPSTSSSAPARPAARKKEDEHRRQIGRVHLEGCALFLAAAACGAGEGAHGRLSLAGAVFFSRKTARNCLDGSPPGVPA